MLFRGTILMCLLLLVAPALAQVRQQIDGNAQPRPAAAPEHLDLDQQPVDIDAGHHADHHAMTRGEHQAFADQIDLGGFRKLAVFEGGRVKIIDTLAREQINRIYGKTSFKDVLAGDEGLPRDQQRFYKYDPTFTYLDLIFDKPYYVDKPLIYVEVLPLRERLIAHLPADEREYWKKAGRLTYAMLHVPEVRQMLMGLDGDLTMEKPMRQVRVSIIAFEGRKQEVAIVSPMPGDDHWIDIRTGLPVAVDQEHVPQVDTGTMGATWKALADAWRAGDATRVNTLLAELVNEAPAVHPATYPGAWRLNAEWIYNRTEKFTLGWVAYLMATLALLVAFYTQRRGLGLFGIACLGAGFLVHTAGMIVRGVLSGRWPIHNQFESFMAIAWFAVLVGLVLMIVKRQWMFGAAAAALGAAALLVANTTAIPSNEVAPVAGILATSSILYIHVNIVLVSYALIALGFFVSLIYLGVYYSRSAGSTDAAKLAIAGLGEQQVATSGASGGASGGGGSADDGGPSSAALSGATSGALGGGRARLLNDLDKAQMVVLQIAFYGLGVGILLGAYWADHAWGRWWGWDPKETWALITWIIYLIAIHLRLSAGVKNRGLTTAWLSVIGFGVMLWCYWGVNMLLAGLHSYA